YYEKNKHCAYCDMLTLEKDDGRRMVGENDSFIAFVPFSAEVPFEIWILPTHHQSAFSQIVTAEKSDLAQILRHGLGRLYERPNDPDYSYAICSAVSGMDHQQYLHWYLRIYPRTPTPGGFELDVGMSINPSTPEQDAELLR
ncbi:MAG: galactose-1-phosphate uridylyltransferase, partial [Gammaproteobacteria bacterium]